MNTWLPRVTEIATRFNVRLEETTWVAGRVDKLNGPSGNTGLRIPERIVWFTKQATLAQVLHEVMHIVTNPPDLDIDSVPEDFLLLQFERCVAQTLGRTAYTQVVDWQLDTVAPLIVPETMLADIRGYEKTKPWRAGFERARQLGLLDAEKNPTWAFPRWNSELLEEAHLKIREALGEIAR